MTEAQAPEAKVMKFPSPTLKTFYRLYTLPIHLARAEPGSERHTSLKAEIDRRNAEVELKGLEKQLADYVKAQRHKQQTWDQLLVLKQAALQDPNDVAAGDAYAEAEENMAIVRAQFTELYH